MIELENICVRFGNRTVLKDINLRVPPGCCVAILGSNGRGKTTLLRTVLGQQKLSAGRRRAPAIVGYVPQQVALAHPYRALDVVVMGRAARLGLFGHPTIADQEAALEVMHMTHVAHLADASFDRLSGGERQLVLLARAIATGANVLVLDEPTAALDLRNEKRLLNLLREIRRSTAKSIIFTSHDPNHAIAIADEAVLMMPEGEAVCGPVSDVITPENLFRLYGVEMRFLRLDTAVGEVDHFVIPSFALSSACS